MADTSRHLFEAFGVELEYMIVDEKSLDVLPVTDRLIEAECGHIESEIVVGDTAWSNELVLHVVELKTAEPAKSLSGLAQTFQSHVQRINGHLQKLHGRLLPSAMHPWMNPDLEMQLWPHEYSDVYEAFNAIFDCRGHGWANLQSVHLNLPFCGDEEFGRLHAAIRLILPLLPGLAASSPVMNGQLTGMLDNRLDVYRRNARRVPSVCGKVIPEQAFSQADYQRLIFEPMYADIAPLDPGGVLQDEFLNARGAIARFGRGSIEIRVIDIQECPAADLAVLQATVAVLKNLVAERWSSLEQQQQMSVERLSTILLSAVEHADGAVVVDADYLKLFGMSEATASINDVWKHLVSECQPETDALTAPALQTLLDHGPLSRRLTNSLASKPSRSELMDVYQQLADCLHCGRMFLPACANFPGA